MAADKLSPELRQQAEDIAKARAQSFPTEEAIASLTPAEIKQTLHELKVHQIELEMQNETLQQAQTALAVSRDRYFNLYDLAPVGYLTISRTGIIQEANLAAAAILGMVRKALIDLPFTRLIFQSDLAVHLHHFRQLFETNRPCQYELRLINGEGSILWAAVEASSDIHPKSCRLVLSDITSRKHVEEELIASNKELEKTVAELKQLEERLVRQQHLAAVGQLSAGIAHDFNNILSVIALNTDLNLADDGISGIHGRSKVILKQVDHASYLVQQILDFGQKAMLRLELLDLVSLLEDLVGMLRRTIPANIAISLDVEPDTCIVQADQGRLRQLFLNLALNSVDAMPAGGRLSFKASWRHYQPGESRLNTQLPAGNWVEITVSDTGAGIPSDVLPRIFEPFFTTKNVGKGSGLGLAQAHGIVKQHKGYIDVQSQVDRGTTIIIHLPAAAAQPQSDPYKPVEDTIPAGQGEVVLIVEDNKVLRETLVDIVGAINYEAYGAANGVEALSLLEKHPEIEIIISDMMMPKMGGAELFATLREKNLNIPMIGMTGYTTISGQIQHLINQGMLGCIIKPPNMRELKIFLNQAAGRKST